MEEYYDVNFYVKYYEIYQELLNNLSNNNTNLNNEEKYSEEDIECICRKLYLDECASVFKSNNYLDDKIDIGFRKVFKLLMKNERFKEYIGCIISSFCFDCGYIRLVFCRTSG